MRKAVSGVLVVIMCLFMFSGCGLGAKNLEERISDRENQRICNEMMKDDDFSQIFKDVKIEIKENHVTVKLYFKDYMDDLTVIAMKSSIQNSTGYESDLLALKDKFEKRYRIRPSIITFSFYTCDERYISKVER